MSDHKYGEPVEDSTAHGEATSADEAVARANAGEGRAAFDFAHALDGCWTATPDLPEAVIGYDLQAVRDQYEALGLDVLNQALGVWRREPLQDQDIIIARKRA